MTIVVLIRGSGKGSEVITGLEEVASAIARRLEGHVTKKGGLWVVSSPLRPEEAAREIEGLSVGGHDLEPHIVKLSRGHALTVCPICGSPRIRPIGVSGWLTPALYACEDCGYVGRLVLELGDLLPCNKS